jgi:hypothetical protein
MTVLDRQESAAGSPVDEKEYQDTSTSRADDSNDDIQQNQQPSDSAPASPEPEAPPRDINGWKWYLTLASILASTFLYALDATVVADVQPVIVRKLGHIEKLPWLSVAFLLCATATNLVWGRIYGHFKKVVCWQADYISLELN